MTTLITREPRWWQRVHIQSRSIMRRLLRTKTPLSTRVALRLSQHVAPANPETTLVGLAALKCALDGHRLAAVSGVQLGLHRRPTARALITPSPPFH
ncbi:MAG: hypothetical protein ABTQ24_05850 [Azonexus sp.]